MKFKYNTKHIRRGSYACRSCGNAFISGIKPSHKKNCDDKNEGWNAAMYIFGNSELKEVQQTGRSSKNSSLVIGVLSEIMESVKV